MCSRKHSKMFKTNLLFLNICMHFYHTLSKYNAQICNPTLEITQGKVT